jgi:hypothetical protein
MRQAIRLSPTCALPNVACCISMGRLAVFSDNKTKVLLVSHLLSSALSAHPEVRGCNSTVLLIGWVHASR